MDEAKHRKTPAARAAAEDGPDRTRGDPAKPGAARTRNRTVANVEDGAAARAGGNPIKRYIACFATARDAAAAAGVSTAMLRRMRSHGYVSTRQRALLMAQACGFRVAPAELLGLGPGGPA